MEYILGWFLVQLAWALSSSAVILLIGAYKGPSNKEDFKQVLTVVALLPTLLIIVGIVAMPFVLIKTLIWAKQELFPSQAFWQPRKPSEEERICGP